MATSIPATTAVTDRLIVEHQGRDTPRIVVFTAAISMIVLLVMVLGFIAWNGIQIFLHGESLTDLLTTPWHPSGANPTYGILPFIAGTVGVTGLAILISAPLAIGLALFLAEIAPKWARDVVQPALEVFVGVPSVVWGWLGITILIPFLRTNLHAIGFTLGFSWFAGSLVLAIMILPTVSSISYDTMRSLPPEYKTASLALGSTRWQTMRKVLIPAGRAGLLTAIVIGLARAAGEALAVQMVIGNRPTMPTALTQPVTTLTSQITLDMGNTVFGTAWNEALWTMALVLLVISMTFVLLVRTLNGRGAR